MLLAVMNPHPPQPVERPVAARQTARAQLLVTVHVRMPVEAVIPAAILSLCRGICLRNGDQVLATRSRLQPLAMQTHVWYAQPRKVERWHQIRTATCDVCMLTCNHTSRPTAKWHE